MSQKILIVDGMALLFRGYYATAFRGNFMKTSEGIPTNGVFQFLRYFLDATNKFSPTHVICCWDMGSKTFRTELYEGYKSDRPDPPEELVPQFDLVKKVTEAFAIPNIGLVNYEADDCIGTLATQYGEDNKVIILTGDLDMLQLVDNNVDVAIMRKGQGNYELFNQTNFYEKRGLYPNQVVDFKALTGDSADNYSGVRGIGEKTAQKLIHAYGTIENILENVDQLSKGIQTNINNNLDMLHLSRKLAKIKCDIPINCLLDDAVWQYDKKRVEDKFHKLEFTNMSALI